MKLPNYLLLAELLDRAEIEANLPILLSHTTLNVVTLLGWDQPILFLLFMWNSMFLGLVFEVCVCLHGCTVPVWKAPLNSIWVACLVSTELEGRVEISQMNWSKLWKSGLSRRVQQFPMSCALPSNWAATGQLSPSLKMCHHLPRKPLAERWN